MAVDGDLRVAVRLRLPPSEGQASHACALGNLTLVASKTLPIAHDAGSASAEHTLPPPKERPDRE